VRDAILETTVRMVTDHGLRSVTMSHIAEETGIGRATLYKYFSDVEAILVAWHERHVAAYALIQHKRHAAEMEALLHRDEHVGRATQHLSDLIRDLLIDGVEAGDVRDDVAPDELASYCVHALGAAGSLPSKASVRRLVTVTLAGLRPIVGSQGGT
jgi:AcrR family transcriptional regulator